MVVLKHGRPLTLVIIFYQRKGNIPVSCGLHLSQSPAGIHVYMYLQLVSLGMYLRGDGIYHFLHVQPLHQAEARVFGEKNIIPSKIWDDIPKQYKTRVKGLV